jgi:hypothetical protein
MRSIVSQFYPDIKQSVANFFEVITFDELVYKSVENPNID